jgi:DNA-binding CsgD family transcriptional regulator
MTRLLYLPDDATVVLLDVTIPARQLAAAVNAGLEPLPQVITPGRRHHASLTGNTVIVFPKRKPAGADQSYFQTVLTPKQNRVLELAMDGNSTEKIAEIMGISRRTVAYHLKGIKTQIQDGVILRLLKNVGR